MRISDWSSDVCSSDLLARQTSAADIVVERQPDLELDVIEPRVDRLAAQPGQLLVRIAEPARRRGVAGIAVGLEIGYARCLARRPLGEQRARLVGGDAIGPVPAIALHDDSFGSGA